MEEQAVAKLPEYGYINIQVAERTLYSTKVTLVVADWKDKDTGEIVKGCGVAFYRNEMGYLEEEMFENEGYTFDNLDKLLHDLDNEWSRQGESWDAWRASGGGGSYAHADGLTDFGDGVRQKR